ncbi:MAG: alpha/beta hydrolase fold domain-containing protein [Sporichthyaceae bacterium]
MPLQHAILPGDIDQMMADDHAVLERRFQHLEAGRGNRRTQADQLVFDMSLHADAKERVLYPALAEAGFDDAADAGRTEDLQAKNLLLSLTDHQPGDDLFERSLAELIAAVRDQSTQEEQHLLPRLREKVGAPSMGELGERFIAAKRAAPSRPHPMGPSSEGGHMVTDPIVKLLDRLRDRASGRSRHLATDASGSLDPQAQRLLDAFAELEPLPPEILEPAAARRQPTLADAVERVLLADGRPVEREPVAGVADVRIAGPGGELTMRIYTPAEDRVRGTGPMPILYWIHGGGWVLFDVDTYDASCRGLANKIGAIVVSPAYRKAPEHVFPAAHDDVLAGWNWLRQNAESLGGHVDRLAIGGESVGGTMAAATCWSLHVAGDPLPTSQVLVYPLTTGEPFGESMADAADARPLNRPLLSWMAMHAFKGVPNAALDPRVNLLSIPQQQLASMPPTLILTDDRDVLRDQGEEFGRNLYEAGVPVSVRRFEGMMHEFFGAAAVLDAAELAQQEAAQHVLAHLAHATV